MPRRESIRDKWLQALDADDLLAALPLEKAFPTLLDRLIHGSVKGCPNHARPVIVIWFNWPELTAAFKDRFQGKQFFVDGQSIEELLFKMNRALESSEVQWRSIKEPWGSF